MLKIRFINTVDEIKNKEDIIFDVEYEFMGLSLTGTDIDNSIINYIEQGKYYDDTSFIDRFGVKCYYDCMSTGCKAALLVANRPNKVVNCIECGSNALEAIILYCKDGEILVYADTLDNVHLANNREVDVELNGIHFTSSSKLDRYIDLGELDG